MQSLPVKETLMLVASTYKLYIDIVTLTKSWYHTNLHINGRVKMFRLIKGKTKNAWLKHAVLQTLDHNNKTILQILASLHLAVVVNNKVVFYLQLLPVKAPQPLIFSASLPPVHHELGGDHHVRPGELGAAATLVLDGREGDGIKVNLGEEGGGGGSTAVVCGGENSHIKVGREGKTWRCI